jgi:threonine/homoserine/homoserine lactone efflux protein
MVEILFQMDPGVLTAFVLAGLLLNLTPGADFVFVTASGLSGGPRIGMSAAIGINLGIAVHVTMAAAGVSALLQTYPAAYDAVRFCGAAYLLYLAVQAWRSAGPLATGDAAPSAKAAIARGFLTNVFNPKTALFIFAFIPQFTNPEIGPLWPQILILGAIFMGNGFLFSLCLGASAGALSNLLRRHARRLTQISSVMLGALALRIALDR